MFAREAFGDPHFVALVLALVTMASPFKLSPSHTVTTYALIYTHSDTLVRLGSRLPCSSDCSINPYARLSCIS